MVRRAERAWQSGAGTAGRRPFAARRQALGFTQAEAAQALGLSTSYLSRLERGHVPLTLRVIRNMAELYSCPVRNLVRRGR
jgi:transcriptional regulator with XRE-family HTH domain